MLKSIIVSVVVCIVLAIVIVQFILPINIGATTHGANIFEHDSIDFNLQSNKNTELQNPFLQEFLNSYDSYIKESMQNLNVPGAAIVIVKDSSIIFIDGYGIRAIGTNDSVDTHTVFRLASLSKGFGALLTGILVKEGVLCWDDKIVSYLPDFKLRDSVATQKLTIRNLLSHTTGLPQHAYTDCLEDGTDYETIVAQLSRVPLASRVGEVYGYQNVAYSLIADIIEKATDSTFEQVLHARLLKPLEINDASCSYSAICKSKNVAKPHVSIGKNNWKTTRLENKYYNAIPAGGINASISDMGNYLLALMGNKQDVVSDDILNDMFTPQVQTYVRYKYFSRWKNVKNPSYGLGWRILNCNQDTIVYHGGFVTGFKTEIAYDRTEKIAICALYNSANDLSYNCIPKFFEMYDLYKDAINDYEINKTRQLAIH